MASPYVSQSSSGYNATPPADDGSAVASNQVKYATVKTKLGDPVKTYADNINAANVSAFAKIPGGASISSQSTNYQVLSADQGKLIVATSAITITTPDATSVGAPFRFEVLNTSGSVVTIDGSGSQTIDGSGSITLASGAGVVLNTDGSNWFTVGTQGILAASQLQYGSIINGAIVESNGTNAVTFSIKSNQTGSNPSTTDPVLVCLRSATPGNGFFTYRAITSALSLTLSSGSTLGAVSNVAFRVYLALFDDAGTIRLGAINPVSLVSAAQVSSIYTLDRVPIASSTAEGGAGAADAAKTFYTGTAVSSKPFVIVGYADYPSGLATAGSWNASPTTIQLIGPNLPTILQHERATGAAKAWFKGNMAGQAISAAYNVSSFTDGATGIQTVNWATVFSSANYALNLTKLDDSPWILGIRSGGNGQTAALCDIISTDSSSAGGDVIVEGAAFGDQ